MKLLVINRSGRIRFGVYLVLAVAAMLALDPAARFYDLKVRSDASIFATVRLEPGRDGPRVVYSVLANRIIPTRFSTWLERPDGERYCSGGARWVYRKGKHNGEKKLFELNAWLSAAAACHMPPRNMVRNRLRRAFQGPPRLPPKGMYR